jgi:hypothetical protein
MEAPLSKRSIWSITLLALALCLGTLPATAQQTFFTDLGPANDAYQEGTGWTVSGTGTIGVSFTAANLFTSLASGSVSEIQLAVGYAGGTNAFYASVWTDNNGLPGTELWNAQNLSSSQDFGGCCGLVTVTGISGLSLTAGQQYFVVLGPESLNSTVFEAWNWNNQGVDGLDLYSTNGGTNWNSNGTGNALGAFDILGSSSVGTVPEPSSLLLLGTGLVGAFGTLRKKLMR